MGGNITLYAKMRHLGSIHKNKIIQGVLDLVGIGLKSLKVDSKPSQPCSM